MYEPWATKRLREFEGDVNRFRVIKLYPSIQDQIAISKTEPGDENNQDISTLVGKVDIRRLAEFQQSDPDAYSYTGGLCLANQGIMEFVEMFKAPIKVLNPLLTATQETNYKGTEPIGAIPFEGIILAHSTNLNGQNLQMIKRTKPSWTVLQSTGALLPPGE
jgi:serine protein kinase